MRELVKGLIFPLQDGRNGLPHLGTCEHGRSSEPDLWAELDGPEDDRAYDGEIRSLKNKNKISKYNCINRNRSKIAHLVCTIAVVMDIRAGLLSIEA